MRRLPRPVDSLDDVFSACTQRMRRQTKKQYSACLAEIKRRSLEYDRNMQAGTVENIHEQESIGALEKEEIEKLYTQRLSKKGHPARYYYDLYLHNANQGICPYCNCRDATTIDHFLPKAHYVPLVITPANLVPCCKDCNKNKLDEVVHTKEEVFFNPYYEDIDEKTWLKGTLVRETKNDNLSMIFSVDENIAGADESYIERLKYQFDKLQLGYSYGLNAGRELGPVRRLLIKYYEAGGRDAVLRDIQYEIDSRSDNPNSWQSAMYRGLIDQWFLDVFLPSQVNN